MDGAAFTSPYIIYGEVPDGAIEVPCEGCPRFELLSRDGQLLSELIVAPPEGRELTLYERDFLEGLALQTAVALENAINHQRHVEYARLAQDLDAARAIQQSLLPQAMPSIPGYSISARSRACYHVGGDYLDIITEPDGSQLMLLADVAGKGLASGLPFAPLQDSRSRCVSSPADSPSSTGKKARRPAGVTSPQSSPVSTPPPATSK
jgi:hypothetical protein